MIIIITYILVIVELVTKLISIPCTDIVISIVEAARIPLLMLTVDFQFIFPVASPDTVPEISKRTTPS